MERSTKINCPMCGAELDVDEVLDRRAEEKIQEQYRTKFAAIAKKEQMLKDQQTAIEQQVAAKVAEQTKTELARREQEIKKRAEEKIKSDYEVRLKTLSESEAEKTEKLQELKTAQIENEKLKRDIESQKQEIELKFEKEHSLKLKEETEAIRKTEQERHETKNLELQKKLDDQAKLIEEMRRKSEQGSQQLQGEVQELMIEDFLRVSFPTDVIEEIGKGKSGADVKQIVRNRFGVEAGIILYESKNTKDFSNSWIEKLKSEAVREKAVPVLVTKTMPKNMDYLGLMDGVWVCSVSEFKGLVLVLRENLLRIGEVLVSQTNKGDKMLVLYDYLTSGNFGDQIRRVISQFTALREGYQKEKEAQQKIWKKRDSQIEAMLQSTTDFVTQIQTIAGAAIPRLDSPENELLALGNEEN